jgi:tetratricopeptide (TPR) repeat protein
VGCYCHLNQLSEASIALEELEKMVGTQATVLASRLLAAAKTEYVACETSRKTAVAGNEAKARDPGSIHFKKEAGSPAPGITTEAQLLFQQAQSASTEKRYSEALGIYSRLLTTEPMLYVEALVGCGLALRGLKKRTEALEKFEQVLMMHSTPASEKLKIKALNNAGDLCQLKGDRDKAIFYFKQVLVLKPEDDYAKRHLNELGVVLPLPKTVEVKASSTALVKGSAEMVGRDSSSVTTGSSFTSTSTAPLSNFSSSLTSHSSVSLFSGAARQQNPGSSSPVLSSQGVRETNRLEEIISVPKPKPPGSASDEEA